MLICKQSRTLRSDDKLLLVVQRSEQVTYGERAFSNAAPRLWNPLRVNIKLSDNLGAIYNFLPVTLAFLEIN